MDTQTKEFAERLKKTRTEKGFSQADLAELIQVHPTHIGRYERGETMPLTKHLKALSRVLNISVDYLLFGLIEEEAQTNLEDKKFLEMFELAEKLPEKDKETIKNLLEAFFAKRKIQELVAEKKVS